MPRVPTFRVKNTSQGWLLRIPASLSDTGKPQRRFFRTRELALAESQKYRGDYRAHGQKASVLPPRVAGDALAAWAILEPLGISLVEAARRVAAIEALASRSVPIEEAFDKFFAAKEANGDSQRKAYRLMGKALKEDFAARTIASISGEELDSHISRHMGGPAAHNQRIRLIRAFWRWSAKPPRKWCDIEAVKHLEPKETISKPIGVLKANEAEVLLRTAEKNFPETIPAFAIALFTGMRKQEIERLLPEDITADGITVPATSAKTKRRRFIHMNEPLIDWLTAYPVGDTVIPSGWQRKEKAIRRLAGWRVWSSLVEPATPPEDLPEWPENALRHTAATVALALGKPIETLIFEHGHSGGLTTLQRHYIGVLPKIEATKIWAIKPVGATAAHGWLKKHWRNAN